MSFRIRTTRQAQADRQECLDYIAARSLDGAVRWLDAYRSAITGLAENPLREMAPESADHAEVIRHVLFKTPKGLRYRILFLVRGDTVYILRVRGSGQDLLGSNQLSASAE